MPGIAKFDTPTRRGFLLGSCAFAAGSTLLPGAVASTAASTRAQPIRAGFAGQNILQISITDTKLIIPPRQEVTADSPTLWRPDPFDNFGSTGEMNGRPGFFSGNRNIAAPQLFTAWPTVSPDSVLQDFRPTDGDGGSSRADNPEYWSISVDAVEARIERLFRKTVPIRSVATGKRNWSNTKRHLVTFVLDTEVAPGATVSVRSPSTEKIEVRREPGGVSETIHVCQEGYPETGPKKAYAGLWFGHDRDGQAGSTDDHLTQTTGWKLRKLDTDKIVRSGLLKLVWPVDRPHQRDRNFNGCDIYEADFTDIQDIGSYQIEIEGIGGSPAFRIEKTPYAEALRLAARWFYRQRSGCALTEPFAEGIERPRNSHPGDGLTVWQTGVPLGPTSEGYGDGSSNRALARSARTEPNPDAWGGWHDAGDWDRRIQHMYPVFQLANMVELFQSARQLNLNLPESGKTFADSAVQARKNDRDRGDGKTVLPDLIHEALWGISLWRRTQRDDGAIIGGVEYSKSGILGSVSWNPVQHTYAYAPDEWSSFWFAMAAAKLGKVIRLVCGDALLGNQLIREARRAWTWAERELQARLAYDTDSSAFDDKALTTLSRVRIAASAAMYRASGSYAARRIFENHNPFEPKSEDGSLGASPGVFSYASFEYVRAAREGKKHDPRIVDAISGWIGWKTRPKRLPAGDYGLTGGVEYPWGRGWLRFGPGSNWRASELGLAYALGETDKTVLHDLVVHGMWFGLGCNPSNVSFIQGLGHRQFGDPLYIDLPAGMTIPGQPSFGVAGGRLHSWERRKTDGAIYPDDQEAWPVYAQIFESSSIAICSEHGMKSNAIEWLFACAMVNDLTG